MFTDIVGSTNLAEALGDQAWERLLRWHDDMLRSQVASGGGEIVNSTGDGFFAAFESARAAIDCAIAIQRALVEHRASTGFALSVRIGLHTAEANRRGDDYSGKGVHVAARVAALAEGGEILATAETLAEAGDVRASEPRIDPGQGRRRAGFDRDRELELIPSAQVRSWRVSGSRQRPDATSRPHARLWVRTKPRRVFEGWARPIGAGMRRRVRADLASLLMTVLVASCGSPAPTPATSSSSAVAASPSTVVPATGAPIAHPTASPDDPLLGSVAVTVSDRLRVRSAPEVSDASVKYEPLLPLDTELRVIGGPVSASGYVWYDVTPVSLPLADGVTHGWVAMADHDGTPWIALAEAPIAGLDVATSAVARAPADPADATAVSASVTAFGLDLYRGMLADPKLDLKGKNVVFSPTSIALALGMARAGAKGKTATEMDAVLHTSGWTELGAGLNALDQALASRDGTYKDEYGRAHQLALKIANTSFVQRDWSVEPEYLDAVASTFGAGLKLVDYASDPEASRKTINAWVSQKTAKRIPELLTPDNVTPDTRLYLVNAIYLKAAWALPFLDDGTEPASFTRLDGSKVKVPTMRLIGGQEVPYVRGKGWQATELRYEGLSQTRPLAMTLILPDDLAAYESGLTVKRLTNLSSALTNERQRLHDAVTPPADEDCGSYPYSLDLFMPRFKVGTRAELGAPLKALGMQTAFTGSADLTGIHVPTSPYDAIHISDVIHQANIDVDEKGTEAAAATAVGGDTGGCTGPSPAKSIALRLNRSFLFSLRDVETGAVLFFGRVVDPAIAP